MLKTRGPSTRRGWPRRALASKVRPSFACSPMRQNKYSDGVRLLPCGQATEVFTLAMARSAIGLG